MLVGYQSTCAARLRAGTSFIIAFIFIASFASFVTAAPLAVSGNLNPAPAEGDPGAGSTVAGTLANQPFAAAGFFTGAITTTVYNDTTNPFGAGRLTFVYSVRNDQTSSNPITRVSMDPYTGFSTDGSYQASTGVQPTSIDHPSAAVVGFNFGAAAAVFGPGTTSANLVVQTNATAFGQGTAQVLGGGQASGIPILVPTPEPTSLGALALIAVAALRRR